MNLKSLSTKILELVNPRGLPPPDAPMENSNGKAGAGREASAPARVAGDLPERQRHLIAPPLSGEEKESMVQQFRDWLDQFPDNPAEATPIPAPEHRTDLYSLYEEFIALKNEIRIESRQFKSAFEQSQKTFDLLESGYQALQKEREVRHEREQEARLLALRALLPEILEVRDRIADGLEVMKRLKPKMLKSKYRKKKPLVENLVQGQDMILRRIDNMLQAHGIFALEAHGQPFDPHTMAAIEIVHEPSLPNGVVVAELRKGFVMNGEVLRIAEVAVNKLNAEEPQLKRNDLKLFPTRIEESHG